MQLFLYLMTTSVTLMLGMEIEGVPLMSLLDGSFLKSHNLSAWKKSQNGKTKRWENRKDFQSTEDERKRIETLWDPIYNQSYDYKQFDIQNMTSDIAPPNNESQEYSSIDTTDTKDTTHTEALKSSNVRKKPQNIPSAVPRASEGYLKVDVFFNTKPKYGINYTLIVTMPTLGEEPFVLNITVDTIDYFIDEKTTHPEKGHAGWSYTERLGRVLRRQGIWYSYIPYQKCYFFQSRMSLFNAKTHYVIALVTSLKDRNELLALPSYRYVSVQIPLHIECLPKLQLPYCSNPDIPVPISPKSHMIFYSSISKDCKLVHYRRVQWDFYDIRENDYIGHAGVTKTLILKLVPYKVNLMPYKKTDRIFLLRASIIINDVHTVARCYVKYTPSEIQVNLEGNERRLVDVRTCVVLDGSNSLDRTLATEVLSTKLFLWNCHSSNDKHNKYCRRGMSNKPIIRFPKNTLKKGGIYSIELTVSSRVDPKNKNTAVQVIKGVDVHTITPQITCRRNCAQNLYTALDSVHLLAECKDCPGRVDTYEWWVSVNGSMPPNPNSQKKFLILRSKEDVIVVRLKLTLYGGLMGNAIYTLKRNPGPQNGTCKAEPREGIEARTQYKLSCHGFQSAHPPLTFRYRIGVGAIVSHVHYETLTIMLPQVPRISISICDSLDMCVVQKLTLDVKELKLKHPPEDREGRIKELMAETPYKLLHGSWNRALVAAMVAVKNVKTAEHGRMIFSYLQREYIYTGAQLEHMCLLAHNILKKLKPVDYLGAKLMADMFAKVSDIFQETVGDREWLHRDAYNALTTMFMDFMSTLGDVERTETHSLAMCKPTNPECVNMQQLDVLENRQVSKFDNAILKKINTWMWCTWYLYKCMFYLGILATRRHHPYDEAWTVLRKGIAYQVNVTEVTHEVTDMDIATIDGIHVVHISAGLQRELSKDFNHSTVLFQIISQQNFHNIFWWYPDPLPSKTSVLIVHAYSPTMHLQEHDHPDMRNHLVYRTNITEFNDDPTFRPWIANSVIDNKSHVHFYSLMLNEKAMLAVRIVSCSGPMKIKMRLHRRPTHKEIKESACTISPEMAGKRIWMANSCGRSKAFVAVQRQDKDVGRRWKRLAQRDKTPPLNYSILLEIFQCNVWTNRSLDPGWSADHCSTTFEHSYGTSVQCNCSILGALASRIFPISAEWHVEYIPIPHLSMDPIIGFIFLVLLLLLISLLIMNKVSISAHQRQQNITRCKVPGSAWSDVDDEILLVIVTGRRDFSGTTSNIKFYFRSPHRAQNSYQISQDPGHPRLLRNSTIKVVIPRGTIFIPTRLALGILPNGRYPSWYCRSVTVVDVRHKAQQVFVVEQWVREGHTGFLRSKFFTFGDQRRASPYTWGKRFKNRVEQLFFSWFLINPITGPWQTSIGTCLISRFERSCVWISKVAVVFAMVWIYFGETTVATFQEEHRTHGGNYINSGLIIYLTLNGFALCCLVHIIFEIFIMRLMFRLK